MKHASVKNARHVTAAAVAEAAAVEEAVAMVAAVAAPVTAEALPLMLLWLKPSRPRSPLPAPERVATRKESRDASPPRAPRMPETPPSIILLKRQIRGLKAAAMVGGLDAVQRRADAILLVELEDDLVRREAKRARYGR